MTATAFDVAGNSRQRERTYTVLAWTLTGFFQPVDMNGYLNTVKSGSTVPLKFRIFAGSTELKDVAKVASLTYAKINCDATAPQDDIETTRDRWNGSPVRHDGRSVHLQLEDAEHRGHVLQRVTMTSQDGSSLVAYFKLK